MLGGRMCIWGGEGESRGSTKPVVSFMCCSSSVACFLNLEVSFSSEATRQMSASATLGRGATVFGFSFPSPISRGLASLFPQAPLLSMETPLDLIWGEGVCGDVRGSELWFPSLFLSRSAAVSVSSSLIASNLFSISTEPCRATMSTPTLKASARLCFAASKTVCTSCTVGASFALCNAVSVSLDTSATAVSRHSCPARASFRSLSNSRRTETTDTRPPFPSSTPSPPAPVRQINFSLISKTSDRSAATSPRVFSVSCDCT
mmetsp:Transcript_16478/g.33547  ORF Transcript_16478/g.33547 Transcript_16478/m.33547 type:complete len:261 (-) Transcript_16478:401-1183(-)